VGSERIQVRRGANDLVASALPVTLALDELRNALARHSIRLEDGGASAVPGGMTIAVRDASTADHLAGDLLPTGGEAFAIVAADPEEIDVVGSDVRGLVYGVLELADRVEHGADPFTALRPDETIVGRPATAVRSVARLFCSEEEDLRWFRDEGFWRRYLGMVVAQRFNRVSLTLGLGYNYHRNVTDAYLYFAYPFLVEVPGYRVEVPQLVPDDRDQNLAAVRFASEHAAARGLDFQLGLWTHAYEWLESPNARQTISGLTPDRHAAYCRDALGVLLDSCPHISGVTLRIHGESGIPERSWKFWDTVFQGVRDAGREVRLDLHAKGLDDRTLGSALETGQSVTVSPKFWAEHMGLPYQQAAIRELERSVRADPSDVSEWHRYMAVSEGSRPFTRYGYGDFLREDRPYDVVFRLWPGTQRVLLWGDPAFAAAYGRASGLAGAQGLEWMEPLTFKGREGTGVPGDRSGYADATLSAADDWEKHAYTYRLFGRLTYDPDAPAETWRRALSMWFGASAADAERALAAASRILPLVTTAHHPSASNNYFWPELYTDMPIVWSGDGETRPHPYLDTPEPRRFGTVSPLDPEVFSSVDEHVRELLGEDEPSGRSSPIDVAGWLERLSDEAERGLVSIRDREPGPSPELRRLTIDVEILAALGAFFAGKLRAATRYELWAETGSRPHLAKAVEAYEAAAAAWIAAAAAADVYVDDLTFGPEPRLRGHWRDRLPAILADLGDMRERLRSLDPGPEDDPNDTIDLEARAAPEVEVIHDPPDGFVPGVDIELELRISGFEASSVARVVLRHRPMNQALSYLVSPMERSGSTFMGTIPGGVADGAYPLCYAFVLLTDDGRAWREPGLGEDLTGRPYHVLRPRG
jgi:hypothetical protein